MNHKLSVVMATYNGERYILNQLRSIIRQSMLVNELIILDDHSTDNTQLIVEQFISEHASHQIQIEFQRNPKNLGATDTFFNGIKKSSGDFIILCDQDDIWMANKVSTLYDLANKLGDKPGFSFSNLDLMDTEEVDLNKTFWEEWNIKPSKLNLRKLCVGNVVPGCSMIINRSMAEELNKHDSHCFRFHDHLIALIGVHFENYSYSEESLVRYRIHSHSVTQKLQTRGIKAYIKFLKNVIGLDSNFLEEDVRNAEYFLNFYKTNLRVKDLKFINGLVALKGKTNLKKRLFLESYINDLR